MVAYLYNDKGKLHPCENRDLTTKD